MKSTEKKPTLYEITVSDMGISQPNNEKLSNVIVIGFDTDGTLTFIDHLEEHTLDNSHKVEIAELCDSFNEMVEGSAGCTVSCHCGPGTLGVLFVRK